MMQPHPAKTELSRRYFLLGAGAIGATATLGAYNGRSAYAAGHAGSTLTPVGNGAGKLVVVTLYGGNDALNTVVPVGDPDYQALRGSLALDPAETHDIGDGFALHPSLAQMKTLWDDGRLAVVHGVGFASLDRSHFHCMDVWQSGDEHDSSTGWAGRWLDAVGTDPLDAVAVGNDLPLLLRGGRRSGAVVPNVPFDLPGDEQLAVLVGTMSAVDDGRPPLADAVARSSADLLDVVAAVSNVAPEGGPDDPDADSSNGREGGNLAAHLGTVAALIEAGLPTRLYSVGLRGFDTHAGQAATHTALLSELDTALGDFIGRLGEEPVTVVVYSEFGRRVAPNASDGTDHGGGGTILVAGRVRPGHHGEPPPLDALVDGDLATTTDFRSVYGGLLEGVLGFDASGVLDGAPAPLALV